MSDDDEASHVVEVSAALSIAIGQSPPRSLRNVWVRLNSRVFAGSLSDFDEEPMSDTSQTSVTADASPPVDLRRLRNLWLAVGAAAGFVLASLLPSEPAYGQVVEGGEKFAMCAVPTITGTADAVFVLDYLTGRLYGAQYNPSIGNFTAYYARDLRDDFDLGAAGEPQFTILPAFLNPRTRGGGPVATGGIYIGELTSGKVVLYGISLQGAQRSTPNPAVIPVQPIDSFDFRQAALP